MEAPTSMAQVASGRSNPPKPIPSFKPRTVAPSPAVAGATSAQPSAGSNPSPVCPSSGRASQPGSSVQGASTGASLKSAGAATASGTAARAAAGTQQTPVRPVAECVPTQYKSIFLRKSDNKYLVLLQLPGPDGKQGGPWSTLGEYGAIEDAVANQDCVALGLFGGSITTHKPPSTYTVEDVVRAMLKAREHANNSQFLTPVMLINCVQTALGGKASTNETAFDQAQTLLRTFVDSLIAKAKQPASGPAAAEAAPAVQQNTAQQKAVQPVTQPATQSAVQAATQLASQPAAQPTAASTATLVKSKSQSPPASDGGSATAAAPITSSATALRAAAAPQLITAGATAAWQRIQSQFSQPTVDAGPLGPTRPASPTATAVAPLAMPSLVAETTSNTNPDLLRVLSTLIQAQQAEASRGIKDGPANAAVLALISQPKGVANNLANVQTLIATLAAQQAAGVPIPNLQKLRLLMAAAQQPAGAPLPSMSLDGLDLPPGASRQGSGAQQATGVRLVEKGKNEGKWEAKHKFYGPKGGFFNLTLGYYGTKEEAQSVHDCAALAVPDSLLYRPASSYTLSQVMGLVRSVISQPVYNNPDQIAQAAQQQALKSRVRNALSDALLVAHGLTPPEPAPTCQARVLVVMRVLCPGHPTEERLWVQLVVINPAVAATGTHTSTSALPVTASRSALPTSSAAPAPTAPAAQPKTSTRPITKYKAAPRQNLLPIPASQQGTELEKAALEAAIKLASAFNGVHGSVENGIVKYTAKVPINQSTWAVSVHTSPLDAARAHDAAAIGIYGREALPFLNTPANSFTRAEVEQAMESLATKFPWVRKKHMAYVLKCISECGISLAVPSTGTARQAAGQAPSADMRVTRKRKAADGAGSSSQGLSPAKSLPLPGSGIDTSNAKQPPRDSALAKATPYFGVWYETSGPMKGTYSAKQSGPTGQKPSPNVYLLVGFYATAEEAARARDMVAIAMQLQPRLNFPDDASYTQEEILELAETLIAKNRKSLAKDVHQTVQQNVRNWAARMHAALGRPPGVPRVKLSLTLHDQLEVHLTPVSGAEAPESDAVSLRLAVVPRVAACIQLSMPTMPSLGATPPVSRATPSAPQLPASNTRVALTQALAAKPVAAPRQKQRKRKRSRPLDPLRDPDDDPMDASASGVASDSADDKSLSDGEDGHSPTRNAASAAEQAANAQIDKDWEDHRRAVKRSKGVTPSALGPDDDWIGVTTEAGSPEMYTAKVYVAIKDGSKAYLQVGRCEEEEMAARLRDLGALSVGAAARPRLNFDADEFTLSEVELLLCTLMEDYPNHFTPAMMKQALKSAEKHGVRNDLLPGYVPSFTTGARVVHSAGRTDSQAGLGRGAGAAQHQQLGRPSPQSQGHAMQVDLPLAQQRASSGTLGQAPSASGVGSKRERSPGPVSEVPPRVVRQDYVTARVAVVPTIRLHLMVNPSPASHRPPLRVCLEVASGVSLELSVGQDESEVTRNKRQRTEAGWDSDHLLLMLADAAAQSDGLEAQDWDGGWAEQLQQHGRTRDSDGVGDPYLSSQGLAPGALSNPRANHHDLVGMVERVMTQWHRENESVVRDAIHNMAQRLPGLLVPTGLSARKTASSAAAPASRTRPSTAQPARPPTTTIITTTLARSGSGAQLHPHHHHVLQPSPSRHQPITTEIKQLPQKRARPTNRRYADGHDKSSESSESGSSEDDDDDVPLQRLVPAAKGGVSRAAPAPVQRQPIPLLRNPVQAAAGARVPQTTPVARVPLPNLAVKAQPQQQQQQQGAGLRPTMVHQKGSLPGSGPTGPPGQSRDAVAPAARPAPAAAVPASSVVNLISDDSESEDDDAGAGKAAGKAYSGQLAQYMLQRTQPAAAAPPASGSAAAPQTVVYRRQSDVAPDAPPAQVSVLRAALRPSPEPGQAAPVAKAAQAQPASRAVVSTVKDMAAATAGQGQAQAAQQRQRDVAMYRQMVQQQQQQQQQQKQQVVARPGQNQVQQQQQRPVVVGQGQMVQQQQRPQTVTAVGQSNVPRAAPTATMGQHMGMVWTPQGVMQVMQYNAVPQGYVPANATTYRPVQGMQAGQAGIRMVPHAMPQAQPGMRMVPQAMPSVTTQVHAQPQVRPAAKLQRVETAVDVAATRAAPRVMQQ